MLDEVKDKDSMDDESSAPSIQLVKVVLPKQISKNPVKRQHKGFPSSATAKKPCRFGTYANSLLQYNHGDGEEEEMKDDISEPSIQLIKVTPSKQNVKVPVKMHPRKKTKTSGKKKVLHVKDDDDESDKSIQIVRVVTPKIKVAQMKYKPSLEKIHDYEVESNEEDEEVEEEEEEEGDRDESDHSIQIVKVVVTPKKRVQDTGKTHRRKHKKSRK
jgi:hypothetical protein